MDRKMKKLWNCYKNNHNIHTLKWDDFTTFLKDILQTPIHRNHTIVTLFEEVRQKPGQAVTDFVIYLDRLENKLLPYGNKACLQHMKTKLRPETTDKLIAWPNPLKTCQEAIDLAVWLKQVKPSCKPRTTTTQQLDAPTRSRGRGCGYGGYSYQLSRNNMKEISSINQTPLNAVTTVDEKERRQQENLCFYCGRPGHSIAKCCEKKSKKLGKGPVR